MPATPALIEPLDEHNETLLSNVHPADWKNPEPAEKYNLVVLGAGTAGLISAIGAAGLGAKVALIERHLMGGDCLNVGCVPSKGLIRAGRAAAAARRAGEFGVDVGTVSVDFPKVMERMRKLRAQISKNDSAKRFSEAGVDVFIGDGQFVSDGVVEVAGKKLNYAKAVIATGARAVDLPIPGLSDVGCLTNETLFSLTTLPKRLIVIGAGPIGVEMSQAFARFGSEVHLLESAGQILIREDQDAARIVEEALKKDGVRIVSGGKIKKIFKRGTEKVVVFEDSDGSREIAADEILVGAGRAPNVEGMGLENVGVAFNTRTGVDVDDTLQTTHPDILAAGDVCFPYKFTHTADALARIVIQNAVFPIPGVKKKASTLTIPWCTYTEPEIAHVGMYEKDAQAAGIPVRTFLHPMAEVDRAILDGETEGFVKIHVEEGTDKIIGATIVGAHAGDMISEITLAMTAGVGLGAIAGAIHPYPTQAECIKRAADAYNRTRLTPAVKRFFQMWLSWRR